MRPGDTVVVWKLDRLGRSLKELIATLNILKEHVVDFISLTEEIDTTKPGGRLIFHLMGRWPNLSAICYASAPMPDSPQPEQKGV